jgi:hypothetical protein
MRERVLKLAESDIPPSNVYPGMRPPEYPASVVCSFIANRRIVAGYFDNLLSICMEKVAPGYIYFNMPLE